MSSLARLVVLVLALCLLAGCRNTAHVVSQPAGAQIYAAGYLTDGRPYGEAATLLGAAPLSADVFREDMTYDFAATDGRRIAWKTVVGVREGDEVRIDLAGAREKSAADDAVLANKVFVGMTTEDVRRSWGPPHRKTTSIGANGRTEVWTWDYSNYDARAGRTGLVVQSVVIVEGKVASADTMDGR